MNKLTLEQVRDELRGMCAYLVTSGAIERWADAIDAELKARGEPVAFRYMRCFPDIGFSMTDWMGVKECAAEIAEAEKQGKKIEYAYAAPPTPKIEVTEAVVRRAAKTILDSAFDVCFLDRVRAALEAALGTP